MRCMSRRVLQGANHFIAGVEVREAADDCRPEALYRDSGVALGPGTSIISYLAAQRFQNRNSALLGTRFQSRN